MTFPPGHTSESVLVTGGGGSAQALAVLYMHSGEFARADLLAQKASSRTSESLRAHLEGVRAREGGDLEPARHAFREATRDSRAAAAMLVDLGNAEAAAGDLDRAAQAYQRALRRDPGLPAALLGLGGVLRAQGNCDSAASTFALLVERNPRHAAAQFNLGGAALEAGHRSGRSSRADSLFALAAGAFAARAEAHRRDEGRSIATVRQSLSGIPDAGQSVRRRLYR